MEQARELVRLSREHRSVLPDARRSTPEQLERDIEAASHSPIVSALLDSVDTILLVLNAERQVVALNGRGVRPGIRARGKRPGEAFGCVNAGGPGGCGSAPGCERCGALGALVESRASCRPVEAECALRTSAGESLEFNVRASPVVIDGAFFTVVSFRDISDEKRRQALEQLFLHDVANTLMGLRGWVHRLGRPGVDVERVGERVTMLARQLEREITDHRALVLAETGTLVPARERVGAAEVLRDIETVFAEHGAARTRTLRVEAAPAGLALECDPALLLRVLGNMVRNALEATPPGGTVRVWCERLPGAGAGEVVHFGVHNAGAIPAEVQARIFQRSFSTKAARGRGLGTYSMKLLGERYLGGQVSFVSAPVAGTIFSFRLPLTPRSDVVN